VPPDPPLAPAPLALPAVAPLAGATVPELTVEPAPAPLVGDPVAEPPEP